MKNSLLIFIVIATLTGCKKLDKKTQFNMQYSETIKIPSSSGVNLPFNLISPEVKTNAEATFAINDTRKDLIEEIKLTQLYLTLDSPANGDLGFLKSIDIFLSAPGLSEVKIARKKDISSNVGKQLILETTPEDLKEYIKMEKFTLRLVTVTDEFLTSDHYIGVHSNFFVDAKVLGQ